MSYYLTGQGKNKEAGGAKNTYPQKLSNRQFFRDFIYYAKMKLMGYAFRTMEIDISEPLTIQKLEAIREQILRTLTELSSLYALLAADQD